MNEIILRVCKIEGKGVFKKAYYNMQIFYNKLNDKFQNLSPNGLMIEVA